MQNDNNYGEAVSFYLSGLICKEMKNYGKADEYFKLAHDLAPGLFEYKDE